MTANVATQGADRRVSWADLPPPAKAFRVAHAVFGVINMLGLGYVWLSALTRRRDRWLGAFVAVLLAEGAALIVGRATAPSDRFSAASATQFRCSS